MDKIILRLRHFLRFVYLSFLGNFKRPSNSVHILNGHFIDLNLNPSKTKFDNFLKKLNKKYFFIDFDKACELIKNKEKVDKPLLAFSFDDGFKECSDIIAPSLDEYNVKAAFFINSYSINADEKEKQFFFKSNLKVDYYKKLMNWDDVVKLSNRGHIIGNHTSKHVAMKNLSYEYCFNEINNCKKMIENKTLSSCDYFAFPFGLSKFFDKNGLDAALKLHKFVFTSGGYDSYFYKNISNVLSRRHFEANWPISHLNYFLSIKRNY